MPETFGESEGYHEMGEGARLLHQLEQSGEYVFHGSPQGDITELEPRQATTSVDGNETDFEWRSEAHQKPVQVVEVTDRDLPKEIKIIEKTP